MPERHLARFVVEIVDQLDLTFLKQAYVGRGSRPYNPEMLLALLFYGYATGVFSSRKLERSTYDSVALRLIAANTHPDHDTIAVFRRRFSSEIDKLFTRILLIAHQMEILKVGSVSLDGSKVKANASKHKALSYEHASKLEAQIRAEVAELLKKAESADNADLPDGMSIPDELKRREDGDTAGAEKDGRIAVGLIRLTASPSVCTQTQNTGPITGSDNMKTTKTKAAELKKKAYVRRMKQRGERLVVVVTPVLAGYHNEVMVMPRRWLLLSKRAAIAMKNLQATAVVARLTCF